jgi:hypothetical protein
MTMSVLPQTVLAETISRDQLNQLAAVMLGLVVFAAIFALIERQRSRRGKDPDHEALPPIDAPTSSPPRYVSDSPSVAITTAPPSQATAEVAPDDLPVPFVPRGHEPSAQPSPSSPATPGPHAAPAPEQAAPHQPELPQPPPSEQPPGPTPPASPDEIGIVLPDEPPPPGSGGGPPRP